MKVIVRTQVGFGGCKVDVYKYSQKRLRDLIDGEIKDGDIENLDEVEEDLKEDQIYSTEIMKPDYGIYYDVRTIAHLYKRPEE